MNETAKMKPGTVFCVLCQGVVSYKKGEIRRFNEHMNIEHGAYHNLRYILAGCLMNSEERNIVAEIIEEREKVDDGQVEVVNNEKEVSILDRAFPLVKDDHDENIDSLEQNIQCTLCDSTFAKGAYLRKHLIRFHKLSKEERDNLVTESVAIGTTDSVKKPTSDETELNEKSALCTLCEVSFANAYNLKRHLSRFHKMKKEEIDLVTDVSENSGDMDNFNCQLCEYSCTKESSLKIHKTLRHKGKEKLEKMLVSKSLFKKKTATNAEEAKNKMNCNKCDYSCNSEKELRYHSLKNHRHAFRKRSVKFECNECDQSFHNIDSLRIHKESDHSDANFEECQEILLVEEPEGLTDVSLDMDLNDTLMSTDDNDIGQSDSMKEDERASRLKLYNDKKAEFVKKSEYFKSFPKNLLSWSGIEEDLVPGENLPEAWGVKNAVSPAGRKYYVYVTPDRIFRLRSLIAVLEYVKCCGLQSEAEIQKFDLKLKSKSL
eukprot:GFUD01028964.1.p1 GENE.GFUD01028964.1~~GFUD01028964.1.p1  ORF type:complete len:488 (+),score=96.23 GFUD01028964.1:238-1701(+)